LALAVHIERLAVSTPARGDDTWLIAQHLLALSAVMPEEASDWKVLYPANQIHPK